MRFRIRQGRPDAAKVVAARAGLHGKVTQATVEQVVQGREYRARLGPAQADANGRLQVRVVDVAKGAHDSLIRYRVDQPVPVSARLKGSAAGHVFHTPDGRISFYVADSKPLEKLWLITALGTAMEVPLPAGYRLESGPYAVQVLGG